MARRLTTRKNCKQCGKETLFDLQAVFLENTLSPLICETCKKKKNQPPRKKYNYRQKSDGEGSPAIGIILQIIVGIAVLWFLFFRNR